MSQLKAWGLIARTMYSSLVPHSTRAVRSESSVLYHECKQKQETEMILRFAMLHIKWEAIVATTQLIAMKWLMKNMRPSNVTLIYGNVVFWERSPQRAAEMEEVVLSVLYGMYTKRKGKIS